MAGRDIAVNLLGKETVSPAAKKAGAAIEDLGDELRDTAKDADKLDDEIEGLNRTLRGLAAAYAAAGSEADRADIVKSIRVDQRQLRQKLNIRKLMGDVGEDGAKGFFAGFSTRIGPLVARAPLSPGLLGAVAAAVPVVAPAVSNMIALGAAGGATALGVAISTRNPVVASGIASLKDEIGDQLAESAKPFTPAVLRELDDVRAHFKSLRPDLDAVFAKASTYLDPLEDGLAGFVRGALPGLKSLVDAAEPLVDVLQDELPELGEDFAEMMEDVAAAAREGKDELRLMVDAVGLLVRTSGGLLPIFTETNGLLELYNAQLEKAQNNGPKWIEPTAQALKLAAFEASSATDAVRSFREEMDKLINDQLSLEQANLAWQEAIDDTRESLEDNGKTLDANTEKGRANRQALLDQARAGLDYAQAVYDEKAALGDVAGAEKAAEKAYRTSRAALVKQAEAFLGSKEKAEAYVTEVLGIPPTRNTRADFTGDSKGVAAWKRTLSGIPREIFTSARLRAIVNVEVRREQATEATGRWAGGPVKAHHAYIVGEKRPEVFVPEQSGHIIPSVEEYQKRHSGMSGGGDQGLINAVRANTREVAGLRQDLRSGTLKIDDRRARLATVYARGG